MSLLQPSPPHLLPEESDATIMRRFLDACKESPEARKEIALSNLPLGETSISDCPGTPLTTNLLPLSPLLQRPTQTPNLSTPPSLANTTASPDLRLPSTRQPSQIVHRRPTAADFVPPMEDLPPHPTHTDHTAAQRLQHLYRISKKCAARKIFGNNSPGFDGTIEDATMYFTQAFGPSACDTTTLQEDLSAHVPSVEPDDSIFVPPTPEELATKLRSMANSTPGHNRLEYRHLRLLDPKCHILAKIYHHCFTAQDVPSA